jgi:hypothetical protein
MNRREHLVEKAAAVIWRWLAEGLTSRASGPIDYLGGARAVVDALLPQVTTDTEVWALPRDSVLICDHGSVFRLGLDVRGDKALYELDGWVLVYVRDLLAKEGPLTVVWTPEVDHADQ